MFDFKGKKVKMADIMAEMKRKSKPVGGSHSCFYKERGFHQVLTPSSFHFFFFQVFVSVHVADFIR